jgi:cholesterol transport system auxiliary component
MSVSSRYGARPPLARRGFLTLVAGFGTALATGGCSPVRLLTSGRPPSLYTLTPAKEFAAGLPRAAWQLLIETPLANSAVDTPRIALGQVGNRLTYYADANWIDTGPDMIQSLLVESFENSRRIVAVGAERSGLRADFILKTDLRDFQATVLDEDGKSPPEARVRINAKLVRMPRRNIIASDTFEATIRAQTPSLRDVVAAFDRAAETVLRRIVEWTLQQGQANIAADPLPNAQPGLSGSSPIR